MKLSHAQQEALDGLQCGIQPRKSATIKALLKRSLIEIAKRYVGSYQVNAEHQRIDGTEQWITEYRVVVNEEPKIYPNWESAQDALDRGETVRIEMEPFQIDPALVQLAIDLQHKERFVQWSKEQGA